MASTKAVRSSNAALKSDPSKESLTAVFTGATAGIGLATLQAFARHIPHPTAIIVGRSKKAFRPHLEHLSSINPQGSYTFLEADVSLLRNIDAVTARIVALLQQSQKKVDLLCMSQGYLNFSGREDNTEGLDTSTSLRYYGRLRLAQNLLPHLSASARVLSVLAGGWEGAVFEDDLDLATHYSLQNEMGHFCTLTSLSFDALAKQHPSVMWLHVYPGIVATNLLSRNSPGGILGFLLSWLVEPILSLYGVKPEVCGERMLHYAMRPQGQDGRCQSLDDKGTLTENASLKKYRAQGLTEKVVEHNQQIFERVLAH